jgi:hypothetical protein
MAHQGVGAWREGNRLVVTKHIQLPDRCVKCNAPSDGRAWQKTLYWHHPALYLLIFFPGILIYAIVALIVRQNTRVAAYLCPVHRKSRNRVILLAWFVALLGVATLVFGFGLAMERSTEGVGFLMVFGSLLIVIVAGILGAIFAPPLSPAKMQGNYAWLKGAGNDFLATFPPTGQ